jgi:two-component system heavy metal sensor histidine kinase CusS
VLLNLLANALCASPRSSVITLRSALGAGVWRISLEDQGPGVPTSEQERIFERFVRLDNSRSEERGSGLGLAICRSIIELHRGRIWAENAAIGSGLKVLFEIPATGLPLSGTLPELEAADEPVATDLA